jgi:hypothetical protein
LKMLECWPREDMKMYDNQNVLGWQTEK